MTVITDPSEAEARAQATNLLTQVLAALADAGFTREAVDRYVHPRGYRIEHHYSGGQWELKVWHPPVSRRRPDDTVKWSWHRELPTVSDVLQQVRGDGPSFEIKTKENGR